MKTKAKVHFELLVIEEGKYLPEVIKPGTIYFVPWLNGSMHLCACGCGQKIFLPIKACEWQLQNNGGKATITPSIQQRIGCKSHYVIQNGIANIL